LLDELQTRHDESIAGDDPNDAAMYDRLACHYADWVRLYQRSPQLDKAFVGWVTQLTAQGILKGEVISSFFFRVCVEACVTIYSELINIGDHVNAFQPVDALARLIVLMIKYNGDAITTKVHYLTKILSIVVVVLAHLHEETGLDFPQKPFFRLFSTIFIDLHTIESTLHGAYPQLLNALWWASLFCALDLRGLTLSALSVILLILFNRHTSPALHFPGLL
jgi:CCR4-NOT transcription complex subunit 1